MVRAIFAPAGRPGGETGSPMTKPTPLRRRHYREGDHVAVAEIFTEAIHQLTTAHYSQTQRDAWAPRPVDLERWRWRCERKRPFLAVTDDDVVAAFLELDPDGHVDCTYVHPRFARRGAMSLLMGHTEAVCRAQGIPRLSAEVSHTALPFFHHQGWRLQQAHPNVAERAGIRLENFLMEKPLDLDPGA